VLRRHWRSWTAVVDLCARRRRARRRVRPRDYHALHAKLLEACRELAGGAQGSRRAYYEGLANLARPWLTPGVLEQADREILLDLFERCRSAERQLGARTWLGDAARRAARVLGVAAFAALVILVAWPADWRWLPALDWLDGSWRLAALGLRRLGNADWLLLGGAAAVGAAILVAWRATGRV
jgi:hypothetical protein